MIWIFSKIWIICSVIWIVLVSYGVLFLSVFFPLPAVRSFLI